jgi:hypothetical protein
MVCPQQRFIHFLRTNPSRFVNSRWHQPTFRKCKNSGFRLVYVGTMELFKLVNRTSKLRFT